MKHVEDSSRGAGAGRYVAGSATVHTLLFFAAASFPRPLDAATIAAQAEKIRPYLVAIEGRTRASDITAMGNGCDRKTANVNDSDGDGIAGGGEKHEDEGGAMGATLSREREKRRWSAPRKPTSTQDDKNGEAGIAPHDFGIVSVLAKKGALPFPLHGERSLDKSPDPILAKGTMWAPALGTSFGNDGAGLSGVGLGGGGKGEGIGIGGIGALGHTDGKVGMGTGGKGAPESGGFGMSWGDGHGRPLIRGARGWATRCGIGGSVKVSGRLPPEAIQRVVRANFGRFRLCYEDGLFSNPALAGRVSTKFVIGSEGEVLSSADEGSDLPDPSVVSCVTRAFSGLTFPAPPDPSAVTVVYPITFSSEMKETESFTY